MENKQDLEELNTLEDVETLQESSTMLKSKPKRVMTDKQKEVLKLAREKYQRQQKEKKAEQALYDEKMEQEIQRRLNEYKQMFEQDVVKKAISIKKKQIKQRALLEELSDDDTPMEKIKEIAKNIKLPKSDVKQYPEQTIKPQKEKPKFIYV